MIALEHIVERGFSSNLWEFLFVGIFILILVSIPIFAGVLNSFWHTSKRVDVACVGTFLIAAIIVFFIFIYNYKSYNIHLTKYYVQDITVEDLINNYDIYEVDWPYFYILGEE